MGVFRGADARRAGWVWGPWRRARERSFRAARAATTRGLGRGAPGREGAVEDGPWRLQRQLTVAGSDQGGKVVQGES